MKKTLLSVLAGLAVINAASAEPSPEDRKAMCERYPEKYVWVEKGDGACVPYRACGNDKFKAYCISDFLATQVNRPEQAYQLVNMYLMVGGGEKCQKVQLRDGTSNNIGQDFVQCTTSDGYYEFEFDDVSESFDDTAEESILGAICQFVHGAENFGSLMDFRNARSKVYELFSRLKDGYVCLNISEEVCASFANEARAIIPNHTYKTHFKAMEVSEYSTGDPTRACHIGREI